MYFSDILVITCSSIPSQHSFSSTHDITGMQTVCVMGNEDETMKILIEHIPGYLEYSGSVNGNDS